MDSRHRLLPLILLFVSPLVIAEPPISQAYGPPQTISSLFQNNNPLDLARGLQSFRESLSSSGNGAVGNSAELGANIRGPKVFRHVSLFVAPKDTETEAPKVQVIRAQKSLPDKNYQIIFIKAPSRASSQQTEVILPSQLQQKTLVYVLVKKSEGANNIKIRGPASTKAPPPEVYFIKYKGGNNLSPNAITGPSTQNYKTPTSNYGLP